jgi:hypothetical protein
LLKARSSGSPPGLTAEAADARIEADYRANLY